MSHSANRSLARAAATLFVFGSLGCGAVDPDATAPPPTPTPTAVTGPHGIRFENRAAEAGIRHSATSGGETAKRYIIETTGVGVAVADFDGDGVEDLYFANGSTVEAHRHGDDPPGWLYRGRGDGTYEEISERAGAAVASWGGGAYAADYDNDGNVDLYLTAWGKNTLLHNRGDGTFEDETLTAGVGDPGYSLGAVFADLDRDGHPDLYVANYLEFDLDDPPNDDEPCKIQSLEIYGMCGPLGLTGQANRYYRNRGDGTFTAADLGSGLIDSERLFSMAVAAFDADGDHTLDLLVANDSVANQFYRQTAIGRFRDESVISGAAFNEMGKGQASMGIAIGDVDGDGDDDIFTTNFDLDRNTLHRNEGNGIFTDITDESGLGPPSMHVLGWATGFLDLDNDGDLDVFTVNGHTYPEVASIEIMSAYHQQVQLFVNDGAGHFEEVEPAAGVRLAGRGASMLDADDDGRVDLVVTSADGPAALLTNRSAPTGTWLSIELSGTDCSRDAYGTRLHVSSGDRVQHRSLIYAQSYLSTPSRRLHFGLADASSARIDVHWPCGRTQTFSDVRSGQRYSLREGDAQLVPTGP